MEGARRKITWLVALYLSSFALAHCDHSLGFVTETVGFMTECAEDDNDTVVQHAHKLKAAVESVAGSVRGL
jgi:hypothetical protein